MKPLPQSNVLIIYIIINSSILIRVSHLRSNLNFYPTLRLIRYEQHLDHHLESTASLGKNGSLGGCVSWAVSFKGGLLARTMRRTEYLLRWLIPVYWDVKWGELADTLAFLSTRSPRVMGRALPLVMNKGAAHCRSLTHVALPRV